MRLMDTTCNMETFLAKDIKPASPQATEFADILNRFLKAKSELETAKQVASKTHYTGQYSTSDLFAEEQERYNRAVDELYSNIHGTSLSTK